MEMMTLLKWQLQQPTRNETKFQPADDSMRFFDKFQKINNAQNLSINNKKNNKSSRHTHRQVVWEATMDKQLPRPSKTVTRSTSSKATNVDADVDDVISDSQREDNSSPNSPGSPRQPRTTSLYRNVSSMTITPESDTPTPTSYPLSQITDKHFESSHAKEYEEHPGIKFKSPRFNLYPNYHVNKTDLNASHDILYPQDLSKSYPPYQDLTQMSSTKKLIASASLTPHGHSLLSPPLSSLSTLSTSSSSSSTASPTPGTPFRLFSMQPSSLFPISFPTANISIPTANIPMPIISHPFINKDNIPHNATSSHLPLTPPSPPHPSPPHTLPPQSNDDHIKHSFLSRKRRHSTAPILVDTNIPFSTYLQNLTKTLQASARTNKSPNASSNSHTLPNPNKPTTSSEYFTNQQEPDSSSNDFDYTKSHDPHTSSQINNNSNDGNSNDESELNKKNYSSTSKNYEDNNKINRKEGQKSNDFSDDNNSNNEIEDYEDDGNDAIIKTNRNDIGNDDDDDNDDEDDEKEDDVKSDEGEDDEFENTRDSHEQINLEREKLRQRMKHRSLRRDRRFKRHRHVSELFIPGQHGDDIAKREELEQVEARQHPLSAPVFAGVAPRVSFPNPASLYHHYQSFSDVSMGKTLQQPSPLHPQHLHHHHHHQQQQQHLHRHHPHHHHHHHQHHRLSMALSSLPLHTTPHSPPPLLQSQLTPPTSQFSPSHNIYNKLFPGLGASPPPHQPSRFTDLHTAAGRVSVPPGPHVPTTRMLGQGSSGKQHIMKIQNNEDKQKLDGQFVSGFFTSQFLGLGGLSMRRPSSDKPPPVKKYKCDVCQKAFSRSNTLVTHKRIHTGDKPFKCEVCGRAFRQPGNLTRHRLTHTTHKPYVCHVCGKAFNRASNLNTHIRTHNSFRQFGCTVCPKTPYHPKTDFSGDRTFKCDICGRCFAHTTTLLAHRRTHVGI